MAIYRVSTIGWAALCLLKRLTLSIPKLKTSVKAWTSSAMVTFLPDRLRYPLRAVHIVCVVIDRLVDGERLFARDRMLGRWNEGVTAHGLRASQDFLAKRCIAEREV